MLNSKQERELAYLVRIDDITPIEGYDRVELAHVGGWTIVVGKDDLYAGDLAIYFEIDSQLPEEEPFSNMDFLVKKHFKIKTQKMCKSISQGMICPISAFKQYECVDENSIVNLNTKEFHNIDDDTRFLTKELKVIYATPEDRSRKSNSGKKQDKYQKLINKNPWIYKNPITRFIYKFSIGKIVLFALYGKNVRDYNWPEWVVKTDEERCLVADTKIITDKGKLRIGDIVNKHLPVNVLSVSNSGKAEYKPIVSYQKYNCDSMLFKIKVPYRFMHNRKNSIVCTADHKFLTSDGIYKCAKDLTIADKLQIYSKTYSADIIPYLYGNLLGDGCITQDSRYSNSKFKFSFTQGEAHKEYIQLLNDIYSGGKLYEISSGYKSINKAYNFFLSDTDILQYFLYKDGTIGHSGTWKVTRDFCKHLTIASLALWYMDDGSCSFEGSKMKKNPVLCTHAFSIEEVQLLSNCLNNKFGYNTVIRFEKHNNKEYPIIVFSRESGYNFFRDIAQYMPKCMKYKLPEDLQNVECVLYNQKFIKQDMTLPVPILSIEQIHNNRFHNRHTYDIEVADNHNFFASNILTHNCQNMTYILQDKSPWIVTEKIDGTSTTFTLKKNKKTRDYFICSRNVCFGDDNSAAKNDKCFYESNVYKEMSAKYNIKKFLNWYMDEYNVDWVTLQGETYGEGIQKRDYSLKEHRLVGFNLIDSERGRLNSVEASLLCEKFGISWVPILDTNYILPDTVEELLDYATDKSVIDGGMREGIVLRSQDGTRSFKAVSNEYLLKYHQ